jgi:hypothetical protein
MQTLDVDENLCGPLACAFPNTVAQWLVLLGVVAFSLAAATAILYLLINEQQVCV